MQKNRGLNLSANWRTARQTLRALSGLGVMSILAQGCAGAAEPALPPPTYEDAPLPEWSPPEPEATDFEAILAGGEPVGDDSSPSLGGAGGAPTDS